MSEGWPHLLVSGLRTAARSELTKDVRVLLDQAEQVSVESTSDHPAE
ncbi:hypothetical protein BJY24_000127 [Nocardia transvalensis]|uniref:Uncharacterized protein n=1 Tax=Nocardia transvalensis TaxID=37333 RepID=A0A7W9P8E7_9NOCA|nr:hypothetical protein [Nocardia transvalensis]MBB5911260.1 hypothetical protein [Nocardia transvalensis]